jgi:rare lipoprotein A (peptidoglycan hydrolase)
MFYLLNQSSPRLKGLVALSVLLLSPMLLAAPTRTIPKPWMPKPPTADILTTTAEIKIKKPQHRARAKYHGEYLVSSWYGPHFDGKRTASGVIFHQEEMTVASRTMRFGTKLLLVNPINKRYVLAVVNDRGPYITGRDLDVSHGVAERLGFLRKGVTKLVVLRANNLSPEATLEAAAELGNSKPIQSGTAFDFTKSLPYNLGNATMPSLLTYNQTKDIVQ